MMAEYPIFEQFQIALYGDPTLKSSRPSSRQVTAEDEERVVDSASKLVKPIVSAENRRITLEALQNFEQNALRRNTLLLEEKRKREERATVQSAIAHDISYPMKAAERVVSRVEEILERDASRGAPTPEHHEHCSSRCRCGREVREAGERVVARLKEVLADDTVDGGGATCWNVSSL
ncbi:hypothetical protein EJ02DRAFT_430313 [Clathrospora elynae]|uniref:Uncharacterized protein n=1 Tax=Clathrospora elynae TaxID=706981 RepID=A0A6A5T5G3_9PLEO|nr:hypothetical protein EJ02DRAFT_430313 [Clathrospora elynae]